jgi:hypothetical protein
MNKLLIILTTLLLGITFVVYQLATAGDGDEESGPEFLDTIYDHYEKVGMIISVISTRVSQTMQINKYLNLLTNSNNELNTGFSDLPETCDLQLTKINDFLDKNESVESIWGTGLLDTTELSMQIPANDELVNNQFNYILSLRDETKHSDNKIKSLLETNNGVSSYGQALTLQAQSSLEVYRGYKRLTETKARALQTSAMILANENAKNKKLLKKVIGNI